MDGVLLINKPIGMTSRQVVTAVSKKLKCKKVGHTGTLDPFASGLMVVTCNRATKIGAYLEGMTKHYIAEITLGANTDTLDCTGEIINKREVKLPLDREQVAKVCASFVGKIKQIPPMYSAIKKDGEELYKKARRGEVVERKEREVTIEKLDVLSITMNKIIIDVVCSKGTYIRTLGEDIGNALGFGGFLSMLTRVAVGPYKIGESKTPYEISADDLISIEEALSFLPVFKVFGNVEKMVKNGATIEIPSEEDVLLIKDIDDNALAIYKRFENNIYHCARGLQ